ncbi:MAG: bifunctional pyr operon transcriptional regulator/uracil phosphoribosyltransferase PyrR [Gammaproteobacteria bacterium]|nr:MAG: bifunctional pyr operon transcriptional regulator/uracil phosphoribosyltransferase PyrR [Gammaproteobacteria bacterium]
MIDTNVDPLLDQMAVECRALLAGQSAIVVGIHTGGVWVAEALAARLGFNCAELDVSFHRDDILKSGLPQQTAVTRLPVTIDGQTILLVDDVLKTGRTIRAALDELYDYGRPARVLLAVLVDRGGYELPIRADVTGKLLSLTAGQSVKLTGPEPLEIQIREAAS